MPFVLLHAEKTAPPFATINDNLVEAMIKKISHYPWLLLMICVTGCGMTGTIRTEDQVPPQVTVANEMAAMTRLQSIAMAEAQYQIDSGGQYATLEELIEKKFVGDPSAGKLTGYRFEVRVVENGFEATAVPVKYPITGRRSFFIDQSNVMRGADKAGAKVSSNEAPV